MNYNFRCGEIFFLETENNFLVACKFCNSYFKKFEEFSSHRNDCFPKKEHIYLVEIVRTTSEKTEKTKPSRKTTVTSSINIDKIPKSKFQIEEILIKPELENESDLEKSDSNEDHDDDHDDEHDDDSQTVQTSSDEYLIPSKWKKRKKAKTSVKQESSKLIENKTSFNCNLCKHVFRTQKLLDCHKERAHNSANNDNENNGKFRPFPCKVCSVGFTRYDHMRRHQQNQHNITDFKSDEQNFDMKPYKCKLCPAKYPRITNLKIHERYHTGERPFGCSFDGCEKRFIAKTNLRAHLQSHIKDKIFSCEICPKIYYHASGLLKHRRAHAGIKPYKCSYCEKVFSGNQTRKKHEERVHYLEFLEEQNKMQMEKSNE